MVVAAATGGGPRTWTSIDWDKTIDGYLKSVWLCMKYEIVAMLKRGAGVIVNNSSVDGVRASVSSRVSVLAAKHGVIRIDQVRRVGVCLSRRVHSTAVPGLGPDTACRALG